MSSLTGASSKAWNSLRGERPGSLDLPTSTSKSHPWNVATVAPGDGSRFEALRQFCENGRVSESVRALEVHWQRECYVDRSLLHRVLKRCIAAKDLALGRRLHTLILKAGYHADTALAGITIRMYGSHGKLEDAMQVFNKAPALDAYMWCSIISAHSECGQFRQAIDLYRHMRESSPLVEPNSFVYVAALKACTSAMDAGAGKEVHAQIPQGMLRSDKFVGTCLVDMYAKLGRLKDAREFFDKLPVKDVVTWTAMIAGYAKHRRGQEALGLYARMQQEEGIGVVGDRVTFMCLLQACASAGALHEGKQLHAQIQERGLETRHVTIGNCLIDMYAKCGSLGEARGVFDRMVMKDAVTWNAMMAGYVQHGMGEEALTLYASMQQQQQEECSRSLATPATYVCLLEACASVQDLHQVKEIHAQIQQRGLESDTTVGNCLVDVYAKCGGVQEARTVFDRLPSRDVVTWTDMIAGYAQHGLGHEALAVYADMQRDGTTQANHVTFACLLKACATVKALGQGKLLHAEIVRQGLPVDGKLGTALVDMYAKCGRLEKARRVFDSLSSDKDVAAWNTLIAAYSEQGLCQQALALYASMQQQEEEEGVAAKANRVTFLCLLKACASSGALNEGKQLHVHIQQSGLETDLALGSCLVDMYAKCGSLEDARRVFDSLPERDVVTWTAMISGYVHHGFGHKALTLYATMLRDQEGVQPPLLLLDKVMFICLLKACASVGALHQGQQLHAQIQQQGLDEDVTVCNCLVDMYAKCGRAEEARRLFDAMGPRRDVVTWNTMLNGYAQQSACNKAMQLFQDMLQDQGGVKPDEATFTALLVACSHQGMVQEGQELFRAMAEVHGVAPTVNHYSIMVDLLGRSGLLDNAEHLLETMPFQQQTDVVGWTALLSACKSHGDVDRGQRCFHCLVAAEPDSAVPYALLGSIYASAGRWKDVAEVERLRVSAGAWKKPAKACIEVNSSVQEFTVGEEDGGDVSMKLRRLNLKMKAEGAHVPQTELVLRAAVPDGLKEDALCGHAEKLALAYGLLNTPEGTPLVVTKNLRMCGDCHSSTKVMSQLERRQIVVRDAHRVHRFSEGLCSCGDRH